MSLVSGNGSEFCIGGWREEDDPIVDFQIIHFTRACGDDGSFCVAAEDFRLRGWVESRADVAAPELISANVHGKGGRGVLRVDVVDTNELVLHKDLAFFWGRNGQVGSVFQNLDTTGLLNDNALHGFRNWSHFMG